MFIDHIRIYAKAGDGGNGAVSFRREKFVPRGGPDGGDGGKGGDVVLIVDPSTDNLRQFHYDPKLIAKKGVNGGGVRKTGKGGDTIIAKVPPGTVVYKSNATTVQEAVEMERGDEGIDLEPVADLTEYGEKFVLCKGGKGGLGNSNFATPTHRTPTESTPISPPSGPIQWLLQGPPAESNLLAASRADTLCQLALIAAKRGGELKWDPVAERFIDDDAANAMLQPREFRGEWKLPRVT